jgi:hypothetical protein
MNQIVFWLVISFINIIYKLKYLLLYIYMKIRITIKFVNGDTCNELFLFQLPLI